MGTDFNLGDISEEVRAILKLDGIKNINNNVIYLEFPDSAEDTYRLALESIFRWTLRRDELSDGQILRSIKKVARVALEDGYPVASYNGEE